MHDCGPCPDNSLTKTSEFLLFKSLSPATISAYKSAFQSYKSFVLKTFGHNTVIFPPYLTHLVNFIALCYQLNLAVSTTRTTLSVLSFIFQLNGSEYLTQHVVVKQIIQVSKRLKQAYNSRHPIPQLF